MYQVLFDFAYISLSV